MMMMKKNILATGIILMVATVGFISCKRDFALKDPTTPVDGTAQLRFVNASPNFRKIFGQADSFNVFVNGAKITGYTPATSVLMTYNALFPTVSSNYGYVSVPAGTSIIKFSVGSVTNPDSIPIRSFTKVLLPNNYYSFIITDSVNSARDSSQIFVKDSLISLPSGYIGLRFIHAVWNDTTGLIDVWSVRNNRNIATNARPGFVSNFGAFPYNSQLGDTLFVRRAGTLTGLDTLSNVSFSNQRSYTIYYKGDNNLNGSLTTFPKRRHLATYVHQ